MIKFNEIATDCFILATTEQNPVRQHDGYNTVMFYVCQIVQQESIVGFTLWCESETLKPGVGIFILRFPCLRIRRIGNDSIHMQHLKGVLQRFSVFGLLKIGPVGFQSITIANNDIVG